MLFTRKELQNYSLSKAIAEISDQPAAGLDGTLTGLEAELSDVLKTHIKRETGTHIDGHMIPIGALLPLKAQNVTTAPQGGFLIGQDLESVAPALRSASVVMSLGAQVLEGLRGDVGIPAETAFQSFSWLAESEALPDVGDETCSKTILTPRRLATMATVSRSLLSQDSLGIENFLRASLRRTLGTALDTAALNGTGGVQPLGLLNNLDISSITFSATPTRTKLVSMQTTLCTARAGNAPDSQLAYVSTPATAAKLLVTPEVTSGTRFVFEGNEFEGRTAGLPYRGTANIGTSDRVILGDWSKLVIGMWSDGFSILSDPFTRKKENLLELYCSVFADVAPVTTASFVCSSDAGSQ
jgi:HK97 family phage major capsid protein